MSDKVISIKVNDLKKMSCVQQITAFLALVDELSESPNSSLEEATARAIKVLSERYDQATEDELAGLCSGMETNDLLLAHSAMVQFEDDINDPIVLSVLGVDE